MSKDIEAQERTIEKVFIRDKIKKSKGELPQIIKTLRFIFRNFGNIFPNFLGKKANKIFLTPFDKPEHIDPEHIFDSAKSQNINIHDLNIQIYTWGEGTKTVLMVHGWESRSCYMTSFIPTLLEKGYSVVAFDGPAHGISDGEMTNMVSFGEITQEIIKLLGPIDSIIGHSFGGPSTVYALAQMTQPSIKKMVIIASPNDISTVVNRFCKFFHIPKKMEEKMILQLEQMLGHEIEKLYINYNLPKTGLESILLIHDELDDVIPVKDAIDIFEANLNTTLILTKGLGHSKIKNHPEVIHRVVKYIESK